MNGKLCSHDRGIGVWKCEMYKSTDGKVNIRHEY